MAIQFEIFLCNWVFKGFLSLDRSKGFQKTESTEKTFKDFIEGCKQYDHPMAKMFAGQNTPPPIKEKMFDWLIKPVHAARISKIVNAPFLKFNYGKQLVNHFREHVKYSKKDRELRRRR